MLIVGVPLQTMRVPDTTGGLRQVRQPRQQDHVRPNWKEQPTGESLTGKVWS